MDYHRGVFNTLAQIQDRTSDQDSFNARLSQAMTENGYDRLRHPPVITTAVDQAMAHNLHEKMFSDNARQGRSHTRSFSPRHNSTSPDRLDDTDLQDTVHQISEHIPTCVKEGAAATTEYIVDAIPECVKDVSRPILNVLDYLPEKVGTGIRRGARAVGVPQGVAQDLGDVSHFVSSLFIPGAAAKGVKYAGSMGRAVRAAKPTLLFDINRSHKVESMIASETGLGVVDANITWGRGIQGQGMPWENYLATILRADARLPQNFKTFDFFDRQSRTAISAKTLDTSTPARIAKPEQIYYSLKKNIDTAANFEKYFLLDAEIDSSLISKRHLEVAIPQGTTSLQWQQINRAIEYGKSKNIDVKVTTTK